MLGIACTGLAIVFKKNLHQGNRMYLGRFHPDICPSGMALYPAASLKRARSCQ